MNRLLSVGFVVLCSGCVSTSTMGLARTLNRGAVQGWIAGEGGGIVTADTSASTGGVPTSTSTGTGYPMIEGGVRFGASDRVELGAKLGFNGLGIEGKFALARSHSMDTGINVSLNPQVGFFGIGIAGLFFGNLSFQLPVLIGIDFGGHELIIGPRLVDQILFAGVSTGSGGGAVGVNLLSAGTSVGIALKLGQSVRLVPEVSFIVPFLATGAVTGVPQTATGAGLGGVIFQIGLGLLFGSANSYDPPAEPPAPPTGPVPQPMPQPVQPIPLETPPPMPSADPAPAPVQ